MGDVFANSRAILHKGDGNTHISAPPDVCKVPTPGGPAPTPFVNSAQDSMLSKGSTTTTIGGNPVVLSSSELSTSSGDEPGTLGGLISSKFKGKMSWNGSSTDVKIEGKGVVRFLDPTLHNGNTFNVSFISNGRTGLAYGDDAKCRVCNGSKTKHRLHETSEIKGFVDMIFQALAERFKPQKSLINEYLELKTQYDREDGKIAKEADEATRRLAPKENEKKLLQTQRKALNKSSPDYQRKMADLGNRLAPIEEEIKVAKNAIKEARKKAMEKLELKRFEQRLAAINKRLHQMNPVLRMDSKSGTFVEGYMVGACICKCPQQPKMLAACSGHAPPGFEAAVADTPFRFVQGFKMSASQSAAVGGSRTWSCSAPKLLQGGGANGHRVKSMSERWFAPVPSQPEFNLKLQDKVGAAHERTEEKGKTKKVKMRFGHGESVPSCSTCQKLIPEMLCGNHKECA